MSEFASYCTFVRNKQSKSAAWQDDLLNAAQENPELAGAAVGGLGGAATGLFSGNVLRNGLIGAGLGAGAGLGYRMMGRNNKPLEIAGPPSDLKRPEVMGPPAELKPNPLSAAVASPQPSVSGVEAPGPEGKKTIGEAVGPLKKLGLPGISGSAKPPSPLQVTQQQGAASVAARAAATAKMQALLKGTPLEGKDPNNLSVVDQLTLSPTQKKMLDILRSRQPSTPSPGPGSIGKAAAAGVQKVKDVAAAPGKMLDEHKAKADAEAKKEQDLLKQLEELNR